MLVDDQWCLSCSKRPASSDDAYCSKECRAVDDVQLSHDHTDSPPQSPLALVREAESFTSARVQGRLKLLGIVAWRDDVEPGLDEADAGTPLSPIDPTPEVGPPRRTRKRFPLSASCIDPPRISPPTRLLPPADDNDMESLCPPTLALTGEDSFIVTPPTRSLAAPAIQLPTDAADGRFKWFGGFASRLRSWRARTPEEDVEEPSCIPVHNAEKAFSADELLPVGIEAASFYQLGFHSNDELPAAADDDLHPHGVSFASPHHRRPYAEDSDSESFLSSPRFAHIPISRGRAAAIRRH